MEINSAIKGRRSVRKFKKKAVPSKFIEGILEAGRWAPSGLNNQPWRFMVLSGRLKDDLADYTKYGQIMKSADQCILVFLNKTAVYSREKDLMAIGACIQNMLLAAHEQGLGACWLGEILNQRKSFCKHFSIGKELQLEAVIALGYPVSYPKGPKRKTLDELIVYM